jgi:hypothetical protein
MWRTPSTCEGRNEGIDIGLAPQYDNVSAASAQLGDLVSLRRG